MYTFATNYAVNAIVNKYITGGSILIDYYN